MNDTESSESLEWVSCHPRCASRYAHCPLKGKRHPESFAKSEKFARLQLVLQDAHRGIVSKEALRHLRRADTSASRVERRSAGRLASDEPSNKSRIERVLYPPVCLQSADDKRRNFIAALQ